MWFYSIFFESAPQRSPFHRDSEFLLLLKLWPNHNTRWCFQLTSLLRWGNLGSNPNHMEDPSLDFSAAAFSHQVPPQWGIPYGLLVLQTFSLFSRLSYFTESHLLWMRICELPVHSSASKFPAQLCSPQFLSESVSSKSILKSLIRQSQTLCSVPTLSKQQLPSLTTCYFQFTFKKRSFDHTVLVPLLTSTAWRGTVIVFDDDTAWGFPNNRSSTPMTKQTKNPGPTHWSTFPYGWTLFINQFTDCLYHLILAAVNPSSCQPVILSVTTSSCGISAAWNRYWQHSSLPQCFCIILFLSAQASEMLGDRTIHISSTSTQNLCLWLRKKKAITNIAIYWKQFSLHPPPPYTTILFVLYTILSTNPSVITQQHISPMQFFLFDIKKVWSISC